MTITIPPEAVEAAARQIAEPSEWSLMSESWQERLRDIARAAILAALEAWKPSWTETECDNAGVIVSRVYVLDITPEESPDAEA